MNEYWTFAIDQEIYDADFDTAADCLQAMDNYFAESCQEWEDLENGDTCTESGEIVRFRYNDENEREIIYSKEVAVHYQHYHSDLKEHGTN